MAANTNPIFEKNAKAAGVQILNADTTTKKTLVTAAADGSRVDDIYISSTDTAAVVLNFYLNDGATDYYIGDLTIAIGAGYTTVARVSAILTLAPNLGYLVLQTGWSLKVAANVTITAAKQVDIVAQYGDF